MSSDRHAEKFADVRRPESRDGVEWRITVWRLGGHINGSAQPFKILSRFKSSEHNIDLLLRSIKPEPKFAPVPKMIDGRLFVYDVSFKGR